MRAYIHQAITSSALLGFLALASPTMGQDTALPASYGVAELQGNFTPDPHVRSIQAGGDIDAASIGENCIGYISNSPDYELNYAEATGFNLSFFVIGGVDTTLVVNDPNGAWHCNDDFNGNSGANPGLVFTAPVVGNYDIWVGTYGQGEIGSEVELQITELTSPWETTSAPELPQPSAPVNEGPPELASSGTGFIVSRAGHILTNHHVVEGCRRLTFQIRGELAVETSLLASNASTDLALLKTELNRDPAVFRGAARVRLGDEVVVYGFPLLGDLSSQGNLTNGIVSALSGLNDDLSRLQMTAQIQPGNSGGPVMNRSGHIVAVVVETANDEYFRDQTGAAIQNLNFGIQDSLARAFLDTNNVSYEIAATEGQTLAVADIAEMAQGFTGTILCYE